MKQTAVEWLVQELNLYTYLSQINQAKEMEKQQIIDAWNDGNNQYSGIGDSETYYNETFNK
jgi:N-acetyl-anhydromuramyl-L-alanine amidase AmpD